MKRAFILGGHGDIGSSIVERFKKEKYLVVAPKSSELDLTDNDSISDFLSKSEKNVDVLIHCAGWNNPRPIEEIDWHDLERTFNINTFGFYKIVKFFIPQFKKKKEGHILAISSLYGTFARYGRLSYVMSKHALNGLIKTLALELGPFNIKANTLSPGFVDTKLTRKNNPPLVIASFVEKIPLGRLAEPEDIANVAYFLCSPQNNYINGQDIIVDGGYSIGGFQR